MNTNRLERHGKLVVLLVCGVLLGGCANGGDHEVWTTKYDPTSGAKLDQPTLNIMGEPMDAGGPLASAGELKQSAISLLQQAADSTNPLLRANAIEALQSAPEALQPIVQRSLADENRGVRFVAAMTVGKLKMQEMAPLLEPLLHDESQSVQAAAIYGIRRCGRPADLNPLSAMLLGENPEVKANAALVLGELGDNSAIPLLRNAVGRGLIRVDPARRKVVELQLAEAMAKLGATNQIDVIRAALFAPPEEGELVALACQMCGELRDGGAWPDLINMIHRTGKFERPPEIRMAAALALAQIDPTKAPLDVPAAFVASPHYEIRAQAAHTLAGVAAGGGGNSRAALGHLAKLMSDPNPLVQVAAAGGVLRAGVRQGQETLSVGLNH